MAKRQGSELNHDNWNDQDDVKEEAGVFKPLSETELQNRVIKRAKRSMKESNVEPETDATPSPFSAFGGFSRPSSTPAFSFQLKTVKSDISLSDLVGKSKESTKNGAAFGALSSPAASEGPSSSSTKLLSTVEQKQASGRNLEYFRMLQSLNESVLKWVQLHFDKNPCCDFTPVFDDYKRHLQKIDHMHPAHNNVKKVNSSEEMSKITAFKMPQPVKGNSSRRFFDAGSDSATNTDIDKEMLYGAGFASNTTNTSTISFGVMQSPTSTSTGSKVGPTSSSNEGDNKEDDEKSEEKSEKPTFSFGLKKASEDSTTPSKLSLFGSESKPFSFGFPVSAAPVDETRQSSKEEEYVPPKNEFSAVSEDDALYSKRCKLFFQKDGSYLDKGVGTLYLKPLDGKTQLLIRADTNLGNVLLNIVLSSSLPMERSGKNNVLVVCVPNPPLDVKDPDSKKAVPLLIRVKTAADADELLEKLDEYKS